ncbi:MAG: hypothetical protein ACFCGT_01930 [Sandaracinaceae bacterium]
MTLRPPRTSRLGAGLTAAVAVAAIGCGGGPPARYVVERDIGAWTYRRYQRVLDVEIAIAGNPAVGHTATYVRRPSRRSTRVPFVTVFVTVYEEPTGLSAEVRRQVRGLSTYEAAVDARHGAYAWALDAGPGDRWVLWVSRNRVVKVGTSEELEAPPPDIVATYLGLYPSDLGPHGRARPGATSGGEREEDAPSTQPAPPTTEDDADE